MRIKIPPILFRPIRIARRDVVLRGKLRPRPEWFTLHRRTPPGQQKVSEMDPLEMRAIPHEVVKGYLEERIIYMELLKRHYVPGIDFTFQSTAEGGRQELGGIVVDFLLEHHRLVIQVDGPTHQTHIRKAKDREQRMILASMGFTVVSVDLPTIHDAGRLEQWFRQHVDWGALNIQDPFDTYTDEIANYG